MAVFTGLAVALGYLLSGVPNVELVSFTVFASGFVLGAWRGAVVGALAMAIYSGGSPHGSGLAVPPLYAGQILGAAFAGALGAAARVLWGRGRLHPVLGGLAGAGIGLAATLVYQVLVILGLAAAMPEARTGFVAAIASNALFSLVHLLSNAVVFAVLAPVALPRLRSLSAGALAERS